MCRKLSVLLLALAVLLCASSPSSLTSAQQRRPRRSAGAGSYSANAVNARFAQIADAYLKGYYAFNPTEATALGLHEYDSQLESRSRESVAREVSRLRIAQAQLAHINPAVLSPDARLDYLVIASHVRAQLLELEEIRMWQRDANIYNRLVASSVDNILKRNYAPIEQRLDALLAREREAARLLNEARANLDQPPRIYTEMALMQTRGSIDYFTRVVPQMFERAGGGRLSAARRAQFETANQNVVAALRSFADWLENNLLPRSAGSFSIGAENYRRKLLYEEMVETPLDQLLRDGERQLRRTQEEMRALAEEIAPGRGLQFALRTLGREHPTPDGLVGDARAELDRLRAFVRTQNILTPPERENLIVAETPEYARSTSFASMDAPGAFERVATESYYYLTPPDMAWSERQREEHLSHYNRYGLPITSIHEVYPGHYYQLLALKRVQPTRVRATFASSSFVEGWAHYCEQMMLDEGFGGNNPKLRLAQLDAALLRLCRYVVGLRLHTQGMTYEQAVEFFMREGYQERVNAEREARRGTVDPTYLVYTLGKMLIMRLREDWKNRMGAAFNLRDFHDRLLSYGMPPIKIIRLAMLGDVHEDSAGENVSGDQTSVVDFSLLATGTMSAYEGARSIEVVSDENEWRRAWQLIGMGRLLPDVNFNTRAVIIIHQGQKMQGGYSISVDKILREGSTIVVSVKEESPRAGEIAAQVVTSPFVAVEIPRPPGGAVVKFEDAVIKSEQNRNLNKQNIRERRSYRRGARRH